MPEISIVDTKNIIKAVKNKYRVDLSCFSLTPLRHKLDRILKINQFIHSDYLIENILIDLSFFEEFSFELFNTKSELFRDPEFWMYLNKMVLPKLNGLSSNFKILIPACSIRADLISLLILLEESGLREKSDVYISFISKTISSDIYNDETLIKVKAIDFENINKVFQEIDLGKYFTIKSNTLEITKTLFSKVFDVKLDLDFKINDEGFNLILFRDVLLNFSLAHQNKIVKNLVSGLDHNGMIAFGHRENISSYIHSSDELSAINDTENIFQKKK